MKAREKIDPSDKREWYLKRAMSGVNMEIPVQDKEIEVNGVTTDEHSECILIKGFPFFVYATYSANEKEREYHVESPVAIEHLGLPYKVIVYLKHNSWPSEWKTANVYYNGVVDKFSVQSNQDRYDDDIILRVTFE